MTNELPSKLPSVEDIRLFRGKVIRWFNKNKRNYPWRETRDPFKVLIAEMMLRRTKADQVKAVYDRLFAEYPDVEAIAKAEDKKLEQILYPLGLKWRTPAFSLVAREVREKYQCKLPETREELTALPGVGEYVAGAVLSVAYGKKEWIVDSNIVSLFRRYFGIKTSKQIPYLTCFSFMKKKDIIHAEFLLFSEEIQNKHHPRFDKNLIDPSQEYTGRDDISGRAVTHD